MDLFPLTRRRALAIAVLVAATLFVAGRYFAHPGASTATPVPETVAALAPVEEAKLTVHVVGAVRRPGLYRLREGSRVADAIRRAGGATRRAELALINLAAPVADGAQVAVPRRTGAGGAAGPDPAVSGAKLSLNQATAAQLDELPGVGPVTAEKIIAFRQAHGAIASVDDLDAVPGIGPARLEQLRELVTP
ncbi:MAG: helix-hairpin-helix domain-containing protein [Gaiellaceae bacterium]